LNCHEFAGKRKILYESGVEVLLRLARRHVSRRKTRGQAAQQQRTEAENCLVRRTGYADFTHTDNYTKQIALCKRKFCDRITGFLPQTPF
jgi:hypothetical protein